MPRMPKALTIPDLMEEVADRFPHRQAIVWGTKSYTYRELADEVRAFAAGLASLGVQKGDRVAILMGNRPEWLIADLAICSLGGIMVGVNTWATPRELEYILKHSETSIIVMCASFLKHDYLETLSGLEPLSERLPALRQRILVDSVATEGYSSFESVSSRGRRMLELYELGRGALDPDDQAYLLYTSGSTSAPKGVRLNHRYLIENMWEIGERMKSTEHDRLWLAVSLFWGLGCENALFNVLTHGACIVLQDSFDPEEAMKLIESEKCTLFYGMSNMAHLIYEHPAREKYDLSSLRSGITTGTPEQIRRIMELGVPKICNVYGLTETYGNSHVTDAHDPPELRATSVGRPLPGVEHIIVDQEAGVPVPPGHIGEIRVRGRVMMGYHKDPELTASCWDDAGYFRTGDVGHVDEADNLFYHGRTKEMIKTGGINVSPLEVEEILMQHPGVLLAYCTGIPDDLREELLVAVVVPASNNGLTETELRDYCRTVLAAYKTPRKFVFTTREMLPMTPTGKLKKNELAATFFGEPLNTAVHTSKHLPGAH